jgi:F-type H+-transporting ATPase subunit epsilon
MAEPTGSGPIHLTIVTPTGLALDRRVDSVSAPGVMGQFEVLPQHDYVMAQLDHGSVSYKAGSEEGTFAVHGGFAEVGPDHVAILAEGADQAKEIDLAHVIAQKEKFEKLLMEIGPDDPNYDVYRKEIKKYVAMMDVAQQKPA